ncbi:efflux RND transporter periplasmic adaptor subunit, partial [Pseudomonas aeruginosa]|nr:efflux RND transporter periplasmic adaptor subunit [Pseudomonas aeruginosa]
DESAQAEVQAAQAAVETAQLNLERTQVRSPINGRASRARLTAGNLVAASDAASVLTTIVFQDRVYTYFEADEKAFLRYSRMARKGERPSERGGQLPVQIALADKADFSHTGTVDFLDNQVDRGSGTIAVRAVLDNKDRVFTPGLYTRVRLVGSGEFSAVLIDDKAVLTDHDRNYVYIVDKDGLAQRRDVKLGGSSHWLRIVRGGLAAGDRVIVNGAQKVFLPGMPVQATAVPMVAAAAPASATK